jgi:CheY-like chemotaxis protein
MPMCQKSCQQGRNAYLFVDDEAPIAKMGSQILERLGYSVTTVQAASKRLELFQTKPNDFDLVVTDMTMPNMTGDKLGNRIDENKSGYTSNPLHRI